MSKFQVDTKVTRELIGRLQSLTDELDQGKKVKKISGMGHTAEAVDELFSTLKDTEEALRILIERTIEFLTETTDKFDETDQRSAASVSKGGK